MVILACHAIPLCRKGFCEHHVSLCKCIITSTCCNLRESAEGFNRLYRKIGVVCKVSGEVVGTQLIFWVETLLFKVSCPLAKLRHILAREIPVPFRAAKRRNHDKEVAAFFDRHLVFLGQLATAIDLTISERKGAEIVRRKWEAPARQCGVAHQRIELCLEQLRVEVEKERRCGIGNIHSID